MSFKHFIKVLIGIVALSWVAGCNAIEFNGLHINGFLSQGYLHTNHNDYLADTKGGTFDFNEVGLNLGYQFNDSLRFGAQILSRNLGVDGNNKFTFGYLYGDYQFERYFGIRIGKVRAHHGLYNQERDIDLLRTNVFLPNAVYHNQHYTFYSAFYGASIYGDIPIKNIGTVEYELYAGLGDEDDESLLLKDNKAQFESLFGGVIYHMDMRSSKIRGGVMRWNTPLDGLRFGYSRTYFESKIVFKGLDVVEEVYIDKVELSPIQVWSAEYTIGDFVFASEFLRFRQKSNIDLKNNSIVPDFGLKVTTSEGWYFSSVYRFNSLLEVGVVYSEFFEDKDNKNGDGYSVNHEAWLKDLTLSARIDITENWLVKAEYHLMDGTAWLPAPGVYDDANSLTNKKQKWNMIALKTTFSF